MVSFSLDLVIIKSNTCNCSTPQWIQVAAPKQSPQIRQWPGQLGLTGLRIKVAKLSQDWPCHLMDYMIVELQEKLTSEVTGTVELLWMLLGNVDYLFNRMVCVVISGFQIRQLVQKVDLSVGVGQRAVWLGQLMTHCTKTSKNNIHKQQNCK